MVRLYYIVVTLYKSRKKPARNHVLTGCIHLQFSYLVFASDDFQASMASTAAPMPEGPEPAMMTSVVISHFDGMPGFGFLISAASAWAAVRLATAAVEAAPQRKVRREVVISHLLQAMQTMNVSRQGACKRSSHFQSTKPLRYLSRYFKKNWLGVFLPLKNLP